MLKTGKWDLIEIVLFSIETFIFFYPNFDTQKDYSNFQEV